MSSTTRWPKWRISSADQAQRCRISGANSRAVLSGMLVLLGWLMMLTRPGWLAFDVHRQVVHARLLPRVRKAVPAVTVVIDAVAAVERVGGAVDSQEQCAPLHRHPFQRTRGMRSKHTRIHAGIDGGTHKFELYPGQYRGEDTPLPAGGVDGHVLLLTTQHDHRAGAFLTQEPGNTGAQAG